MDLLFAHLNESGRLSVFILAVDCMSPTSIDDCVGTLALTCMLIMPIHTDNFSEQCRYLATLACIMITLRM